MREGIIITKENVEARLEDSGCMAIPAQHNRQVGDYPRPLGIQIFYE
jgi:hypothetical protein